MTAESNNGNNTKSQFHYNSLTALFLNCSLKPTGRLSHTEKLMEVSAAIMSKQGVKTEIIRVADYQIPPGVYPDMTEHGFDRDDWAPPRQGGWDANLPAEVYPDIEKLGFPRRPDQALSEKVWDANILVVGTPIWLGEESSVCRLLIERLYAESGKLNDNGQSRFYGKVGGCIVTGNEDGVKHCSMSVLYALQHLGYLIPPQADAGWIGEAGPGPSYADEESNGPDNDFTQRNVTIMSWNLMHLAKMLQDNNGIQSFGNNRKQWEEGERFGHPGRGLV